MSSNYQVNKVDLDNIFKPLFTNKRANVNLSSGVIDISNYYEPTKGVGSPDQSTVVTGYKISTGDDLNTLFQAYDYFLLTGSIVSNTETWSKYSRRGDGSIVTTITPTYAKSINGVFTFLVKISNTSGVVIASAQQSVADSTTSAVTITIGGLYGSDNDYKTPYSNGESANSKRLDYVTVVDVNSKWTSANIPIIVDYAIGQHSTTF